MRIENGKYSADEFQERWSLGESGIGRKRIFSEIIKFTQPFENPPKVIIALSGFDIFDNSSEYSRTSLDVQAARITIEGFTVQFIAYDTSRVKRLTVDWLAIGA
jgi:hypothetical protein